MTRFSSDDWDLHFDNDREAGVVDDGDLVWDHEDDFDDDDYDGQPDEYTEWQDYMGGDDWDHGQFDE